MNVSEVGGEAGRRLEGGLDAARNRDVRVLVVDVAELAELQRFSDAAEVPGFWTEENSLHLIDGLPGCAEDRVDPRLEGLWDDGDLAIGDGLLVVVLDVEVSSTDLDHVD